MSSEETHWCWSQCCESGPHGCICGNGCPPPSERMVQVPVSLIERLRDAHGGPYLEDAAGTVIELLPDSYTSALLSQPTATVEPPRIEDMAPGTTFTALIGGRRCQFQRISAMPGSMWQVFDLGTEHYWHLRAIDPSTIRDLMPPA